MTQPLRLSSYNDQKSLYAVFEENNETAWLYLCLSADNTSDIIGDVFVCNKVELIKNSELERYKPNLPPITVGFGTPEAVCNNINKVTWELKWITDNAILLTKDQKPWALISHEEERGMCKAIKKSGPWGNEWNEEKHQKLC